MTKPRIIETNSGIHGPVVEIFDRMARRMRDKGWIETDAIIKTGINSGVCLEIGPGPGYIGLEWLKRTEDTFLKGLDISSDMIEVAKRNAIEYGFEKRVEYIVSSAVEIPFEDNFFDGVFSTGSLHEWAEPGNIFNEIFRVLKPNGKFFVGDLRRDMNPFVKFLMKLFVKPKEIKPGLESSINASYTVTELEKIIENTTITSFNTKKDFIGLSVTGQKL